VTALNAARSRRRATSATLVAVVAALLAPVAFAAPASAATLSNGIDTISTGFAIDGNKTPTNNTPDTFDWDDFIEVDDLTTVGSTGSYTFTPTGPYTTTDGFESTGIVDGTFGWDNGTLAENCSKPDATAFPGSQKPDDNPWVGGSANVLPKANGCSFGNAHEIITDDDGLEHHILYQYWTRLEGNGDMTTYQSLEGGDAGRCDDYLVEFNYDPSTGTSVRVLEWVAELGDCSAGADGEWSAISPNFPYQAAVGTRVEGPGLPAEIETFGEMAIDLTLAGLFDEDSCTAFQTTGYITRTGNSSTAELGDLVGGDDPLTLSNCGSISITKADSPADSGDDTEFGYVITNGDVVHDDALAGSDGTDDLADLGDDPTVDYTSIEGEIGFGETHSWGPIYSGDYAIEEIIPDGAPWALWSLECTVDGDSYTIVDDGEPVEDAVIPVVVGYETACVLTNATSALTVTKVVEGAEGETFGFDTDGVLTDAEIELLGTTAGTTSDPVFYAPGTSVTVTELLGDLDWELDDVTCSDGTEGSDGSVTITTAAATTIDCVFTNLQFGTVEVTKSTVGGDGTFEFELQPLDANGEPVGDPITESATTDAGTGTADFGAVAPGSRFSIAEVDPGDEWIVGDLECTVTAAGEQAGAPLDESDFTVAPGDVISCVITNTATATIIVVKNVVGADDTFSFTGDWLDPVDFEITTSGGTESETFDDVLPGTYTLTEVAGEGYDGTNLVCSDEDNTSVDGLTATLGLDPGETITCTYTNSEWGVLIVDKVTVPEGSDQEFEFEWAPEGESATGFTLADESDAFTTGAIAPGDYVVYETNKIEGWSFVDLVCTDPADDDTDPVVDGASATVHVGLGETVTCTFTNAQRGPLTFDKKVAASSPVNNGDGTWTITYDLTVTSESNVPEDYDLEDELDFGAGIVPVDEDVVSNNGVTVNAGWDGDADVIVATGATIPALGTHTYTVTVTAEIDDEIDPDAADCTVADGEGSGFLNAGEIEFWSGTDDDDACAPLPVSDLEIVKDAPFSVDFEPAVGPTQFDYTIVVENLGPATAEDAVLEDPLPADLDFVSASGIDVTCGFAVGVVTCDLGDLAVGETRTITITVSIPVDYPLAEGETSFGIHNVATTSTITPESDLSNNEDDADTTVLVTLPLPPDDPEDPDLPTLALTGTAIGFATQLGLGLLAVGLAFAVTSLRRRTGGRHAA